MGLHTARAVELGAWFGVALDKVSPFRPSQRVNVPVTIKRYRSRAMSRADDAL
jgi:hypothetical protein